MSVVKVPASLCGSVGGARELEARGTTIGEVRRLPAMAGGAG
jgi:hypothetical protein